MASLDYIYYTSNNMELKGITRCMDEETYGDLKQKIDIECDEIRKRMENTDDDKNKQQGVLSKVLQLPNDILISDHLPIAAVFKLPNICHGNNVDAEKCECMDGVQELGRKTKKKLVKTMKTGNNNNKINNKRNNNNKINNNKS